MNDAALKSGTHEIVVDEVFPHAPETIWKTLTNGALMARWPRMTPRRVGRRHSLRGAGGGSERTAGLQLEKQC
jgi:uncharacterized protein YndB with AHSA1/START domain